MLLQRQQSNRVRARIGLEFRKMVGLQSDAGGAKSRFPVSGRVFAFIGIKQREHLVPGINIAVGNWCDCGCIKLIFLFIKISSKFYVMFSILGLNQAQTG